MTGYGRATRNWQDKTIKVELRSLNSRHTDLRLKCSQSLREKETELRRMVMDFAERGKLELSIDITSMSGEDQFGLNVPLFKKYFQALKGLETEMGYQDHTLMSAILRLPNVAAASEGEMGDEEWKAIRATVEDALKSFQEFRAQEGAATATDLAERINGIRALLEKVEPFETARIEAIRDRLMRTLEDRFGRDNIDGNRYEQEVMFYMEKIDINEEKMRLAQHCDYFLEILHNKQLVKGRKLSFISQEIGREINTMGAKSYSSDLQRLVVGMKDELEKIKEQTANVV